MNSRTAIYNNRQKTLSRFCASMANPTRIAILETLAVQENCNTDIIEIPGLSKFTVQQNLKYLKKFDLINGGLDSKKISYCIDYKKLKEFKNLFDEFYNKVIESKAEVNPENIPCNALKR